MALYLNPVALTPSVQECFLEVLLEFPFLYSLLGLSFSLKLSDNVLFLFLPVLLYRVSQSCITHLLCQARLVPYFGISCCQL